MYRKQVFRPAELIGRLPRKIQFSIETRIDLMQPELLRILKDVGLTSITVGIETLDDETLRRYRRLPVADDRQREFIATCNRLGIRTVAGFMIGFPDDTEESIFRVSQYARSINPTFANFNVVTPYPGTEFFEEVKDQIADFDYSHYTVYRPVLKYKHLTAARVAELHAKCFNHFYFRWEYLRYNARLLWPVLQRFGSGRPKHALADTEPAHAGVPKPLGPGISDGAQQHKHLRRDDPHRRNDTGGQTGQRRPAG